MVFVLLSKRTESEGPEYYRSSPRQHQQQNQKQHRNKPNPQPHELRAEDAQLAG